MTFFSAYLEEKYDFYFFKTCEKLYSLPRDTALHCDVIANTFVMSILGKGIFVSRGQLFSHMISQIILKRGNGNNSRKALSFANISRTKPRCLLPVYPGKSLYDRF